MSDVRGVIYLKCREDNWILWCTKFYLHELEIQGAYTVNPKSLGHLYFQFIQNSWKHKKPIIYIWSFSTYKEKKALQNSIGGPYLVMGLVHTKDVLAPVLVC